MSGKIIKIVSIISFCVCFILIGCLLGFKAINKCKRDENKELNDKVLEEIKYYDANIVSALNRLNNITIYRYKVSTEKIDVSQDQNSESQATSSSNDSQNSDYSDKENSITISNSTQVESLFNDSGDINWSDISFIYDNIYLTWPTINLDLRKCNINDDIIQKIGICLDGIAQSIKSKDQNSCMNNLLNLYSNIPNIIDIVDENKQYYNLYSAKYELLNSYVLVSQNQWKEVLKSINLAASYMEASSEYIEGKDIYNYDRISIMLEDLKNCIEINDKEIFFMKYKNIIQQIEVIY